MRLHIMLAGSLLCLAACDRAPATPDPAPTDLVVDGGPTVAIGTRPEKAGDTYVYESTADEKDTSAGASFHQTRRQSFELAVAAAPVGPTGPRLRYTLRSADVTDTQTPLRQDAVRSALETPLEFDVNLAGEPVALVNWTDFKTRYLKALDGRLAVDDPLRAKVHHVMNGDPLRVAHDTLLGDVMAMTVMETRGDAPLGRTKLPAAEGGEATLDLARDGPCKVKITRHTVEKNAQGARSEVTTTATLSTVDGRVLTLHDQKAVSSSDGGVVETLKIHRMSAAPACKG